jgi:hypothetical protein
VTNRAAKFVEQIDLILYSCGVCISALGYVEYCGSVIVVCELCGSVVDILWKCSKCVWDFEELWKCYGGL